LKTLGTRRDGNGLVVTVDRRLDSFGSAITDAATGISTLRVNPEKISSASYSPSQREALQVATAAHEIKHVADQRAFGMPQDRPSEFWQEVRGVRAETPVWQAFGVDDVPWATWTRSGGLNMQNVYKEAQQSTDDWCLAWGGC
jgi:hypothetical protein